MANKSKVQLFILILLSFFTFALITNFAGALVPAWQKTFHLSNTMVTFLNAAFFLAYAITSLPQGVLMDNIGGKKTLLWGLSLLFLGSIIFALVPTFQVGLASLFIIGTGVTALQLVCNLLVKRVDEDPKKYSRNLTLVQGLTGLGGWSAGLLVGKVISMNLNWSYAYYIYAGFTVLVIIYTLFTSIPESKEANAAKPTVSEYMNLAKNPLMLLFALGIFIYVGIEVGVYQFLSKFLIHEHNFVLTYAVSMAGLYWLFQTGGRFTGGVVLNFLNTSKALILYAFGCLASLLVAALTPVGTISMWAFIAVGFFTSIMFPCIFSLAINSFDKRQEGTVAGIICTAIAGGAVLPIIIGYIADKTGSLSTGLISVGAVSFLYIAFIGLATLGKTPVPETVKKATTRVTYKEKEKEKVHI